VTKENNNNNNNNSKVIPVIIGANGTSKNQAVPEQQNGKARN
jgi:hypothetical protein